MSRKHEIHSFTWGGIDIEVIYYPSYFSRIRGKLEIRSIRPERAPLPVSLTGYQVQYPECGSIEAHGGDLVAQVIAWLDEEAEKPEWKTHVEASRQGQLF